MAQLAEDEKLEQMSAQKQRMKMLQLRRDVEQMMADRRQKRAEEMQLMIKLKEQEEQEMEYRFVHFSFILYNICFNFDLYVIL